MALKKVFNIAVGIFLIMLSVCSAVIAFSYSKKINFESVSAGKSEEIKSESIQVPVVVKDTEPAVKKQESPAVVSQEEKNVVLQDKKQSETASNLGALVKKSRTVHGKSEQERREGFLWIDRKSSKFIVTLGASHGLLTGDSLNVYEDDKKIGEVKINVPFDVISYVEPQGEFGNHLTEEYYSVIAE